MPTKSVSEICGAAHYGRTTTLPAALTTTPSGGDITIDYYTSDLVHGLTRGATTRTFTLDPVGRLACSRTKPATTSDPSSCGATVTAGVTDTINHYAGGGDSPSWTLTRTGAATPSTSRDYHLTGLDGALLATITTPATGASVTVYALSDLHGDITCTTTPDATAAPDGPALDTDEYGNPTTAAKYGWLGTHQRETDTLTGLTLMGVRLYTPTTGRFLTQDPVHGGNATAYGYPADPIDDADPSGRSVTSWWCDRTNSAACVYFLSRQVDAWSASLGDGSNYSNAARHFVWNLVLMRRIGLTATRVVARAHEFMDGSQDSLRDSRNNAFAQSLLSWAQSNLRGGYSGDEVQADIDRAYALFLLYWHYSKSSFWCVYKSVVRRCK